MKDITSTESIKPKIFDSSDCVSYKEEEKDFNINDLYHKKNFKDLEDDHSETDRIV